jgi:putative ABC transport system permease protein
MKLWPLVWSALWRKPAETVLVCLAVTAAFTLFGLMLGLHTTYRRLAESMRQDRMYVNARFPEATGVKMPIAMREQIARIPGVTAVSAFDRLNGYYRDPHNVARIRVVDRGTPLTEYGYRNRITPAQWSQLLATPTGLLVSQKVAQRWHLKVGDPLPFITRSDLRADGSPVWEFQVIAIVPDPGSPSGFMIGNFDYVDTSRSLPQRGRAIEFDVAVKDPARANDISVTIDEHFANSGFPTITIPDRAAEENVQRSGITAASITWPVAGAGIFMILLVTANGIAQSVRERIPEFAVLSAVGFPGGVLCLLVLLEAIVPCLTGAALGTAFASVLTRWPASYLPQDLQRVPAPTVSALVAAAAMGFALALAVLSSVPPVLRLRRLTVTEAIAGR